VAGRFPLFTDIDVDGPLIKGLIRRGWDVVRAVDVLPGDAIDDVLFGYSVKENRIIVTNDKLIHRIATRWMREGRPFHGMVYWRKVQQKRMSRGQMIEAFEAFARETGPFNYPIRYITPE
jgi:hypothetical protein